MAHTIRKATLKDAGIIAHLMLVWDAELPEHVRQLKGDAAYAEKIAKMAVSDPNYVTEVIEAEGKIIGLYVICIISGFFCAKSYGMLVFMIYPKYRGCKMYGLKLLNKAKVLGLPWMESYPWADAHGMHFVLERLGFDYTTRGYALRLNYA